MNQSFDPRFYELWAQLVRVLATVYDTHYVCAAIANEIANIVGTKTVVGLGNLQQDYFDVWIAQPNGEVQQERWPKTTAPFTAVLDAHRAIQLEKLGRPVKELINNQLWLLAQEGIAAVPLPFHAIESQQQLIGALCLIDPDSSCFLGEAELDHLSLALTAYIERAALRRQVDQQAIEFAVVSDISRMLASTLNMDRLFQTLSEVMRRILQVESLSVGLVEQPSGEVVFVESLMGARFKDLPTIRLRSGQGIAGWVAKNNEPVIINDVYADQRFYSVPDSQSGFRTRSMICIPLQVEERTIGVLQAINRQYGQFTNHDLNLLQAISGPLAAAIANARLHADVLSEKRRVETILGGMFEGLLAVSTDGYITRANEAFYALVAADEPRLISAKAVEVVHLLGGDLGNLIASLNSQDNESAQIAAELQRLTGGTVPVLISGAPMFDDQGEVSEIILTFSDLTQIREVERMRDDLFHAIAHELRTPLATILMYARLLLEGKAQDEEKAARFLGVIERESDRLQRMVRRMMQLAKQEARELQRSAEPVHLNPLLDDILPPLADRAVQKGLLFRRSIDKNLPPILAEEERLEEIIENLVDNAIKFSPSGIIKFSAHVQNGHVIITISDQGIGIGAQSLPYLFQRFYRAQSAVDRGIAGTGLGLYMVKRSVEQYNGSISVHSQENNGTTFTLTFPVAEL